MNKNIVSQIRAMHEMYDLPVNETPQFYGDPDENIDNFYSIIHEELEEADTLLYVDNELDALTNIADWIADIVIYCRSEAMKYGIPLEDVIAIVMESNMSKLGEDGLPIKDERGKVMKGANYWKPEPRIRALLLSLSEKKEEKK